MILCIEIDKLTDTQRATYDKLVAMNIKNVTKEQLIKAAQEFGANVDGAASYLTVDDPDKDDIGEPNFLTSISHSNKLGSIDKDDIQQIADENNKEKAKNSDK